MPGPGASASSRPSLPSFMRSFATEFSRVQVGKSCSHGGLGSGTTRLPDVGRDSAERVIGVAAQGGYRCHTDDDDQGKHHGVFHGRRAIVVLEELDHCIDEALHLQSPVSGVASNLDGELESGTKGADRKFREERSLVCPVGPLPPYTRMMRIS